jgi:hypothetical protein
MFIISQSILHKSKLCNSESISTYSIASGMVVYAGIYLYLLFYNNEYLSLFNKFIIYIVGIDLLLSTFYYFNSSKTHSYQTNQDILNNEHISLLNNAQEDFSNHTDTHSDNETETETETETESEYEIEEDDQVETTPNATTLNATTPNATTPNATTPNVTTPNETTPNETTPDETTPNETTPDETTPDETTTNQARDLETLSEPIKKRRGRKPNSLKV